MHTYTRIQSSIEVEIYQKKTNEKGSSIPNSLGTQLVLRAENMSKQ